MYLDTGAVRFMTDKPFIFTSGWASPVYNDSRWLISFPDVRSTLMDFAVTPSSATSAATRSTRWPAARPPASPLRPGWPTACICRCNMCARKPKGFGRGAQIEGKLIAGQRVLLVEDLATDGRSKVNFVKAIRDAGGKCDHCFVIFFYDIYPAGQENPRRSRRHTARAHHLVGRAGGRQSERQIRSQDAGRGREIHERSGRLVEGAWRRGRSGGVTFILCCRPRESGDLAIHRSHSDYWMPRIRGA